MQRNYTYVSKNDRERLINCREAGRDYLGLAKDLAINETTARSIITTFQRTGRREMLPRGGRRRVIQRDELKLYCCQCVDENPAITLRAIIENIVGQFPEIGVVSNDTVHRMLDFHLYTVKTLLIQPVNWNTPQTKVSRRDFFQRFFVDNVNRDCIFIDESGFNLWTSRTRGRTPIGERAIRDVDGFKGRTMDRSCMARLAAVHRLHRPCRDGVSLGRRRLE